MQKENCFKNLSYEKNATDCRFQEANRRSALNFTEAKDYFSEKHKG